MYQFAENARTLVARELLKTEDLVRAQDLAIQSRVRLSSALLRLGLVSDEDQAAAFAESSQLPHIALGAELADPGLSRAFLRRRGAAPIKFSAPTGPEADSGLALAMVDPTDTDTIEAICFSLGVPECPLFVATLTQIDDLLGSDDMAGSDFGGALSATGLGDEEDLERLSDGDSDAPIIAMVQRLLANAVQRRASDVHIEPMARHMAVRYRIDGQLVEVERHPANLARPIATRIKVMAALDIAESRLPQDGRLRLTARGRDIDVRVATTPIAYGESIVLRILGRTEVPLDLDRLALAPRSVAVLKQALDRPHGIILVTGPTGSGKTTTLYAGLNRLRRPEVKILTVEDPVEVLLEGINQVQVRPDIDLDYARTLKAFLRQDPDVLMIGEIRDRETADIAMRAALTGHLVLSTLHTNSAIGAFTRLADIGVEPYLSASTVIATAAQRLIRTICPDCATTREVSESERSLFDAHDVPCPSTVPVAAGCPQCQAKGYRGRQPVMEIIEVDEPLREAIRTGAVDEQRSWVSPDQSLLGLGLALVAERRTTIEELHRSIGLQ